ncbi:hypothetical protein [Reyranella sp. CPCC 100927]|uniref:hypothetical protein n=1 Tax=Reyranella sp. CPCC 100927 TaxID=2599616 RepID=UPI0011B649BD|nr:hypothetical protein [Reyranella sp. CPCC 100927]TWT03761.1 hypothetical protein FQU96_27420 [Reyranella sp. CPCC 100927]
MRTHVVFVSGHFPPEPGEAAAVGPGRHGRLLAAFLADNLPVYGFTAAAPEAEDWGWRIDLEHAAFPLWVGCGNDREIENGFLCFIEPSRPRIRRWLRTIDTTGPVGRVADALRAILKGSGKIARLRWRAPGEAHTLSP